MSAIITTSWDDGDALDTRVAQMLDGYGVRGTFYIARDYRSPRVSDEAIRAIGKRHEIAAHTLTHPVLTALPREEKRKEIEGGKKWLEEMIGKPVEMFCYPGGRYDEETITVVREAGFIGARTTKPPIAAEPFDPFRLGVSMTLFPYPFVFKEKVGVVAYRATGREPWQLHKALEQRALRLFEEARAGNGIFHIYGHSWANTTYGLWPVLERILEQIGGRQDCEYLTNGELLRRLTGVV